MTQDQREWGAKGATLSDTTAIKEYGLTGDQIYQAIQAGRLHFKEGCMHGNPWFRLLRREVEELVTALHGQDHLKGQKRKTELAQVTQELKKLKKQAAALEQRRTELQAALQD